MEMGEKIRILREERKMTLEQLGDLVGVGKSTVRKWENGMIANMRRDKISKIADALNVSPAYLMGWDDNSSSASDNESDRFDNNAALLDDSERDLLDTFRILNDEGQRRVLERAHDLVDDGFVKGGMSSALDA